ncbi:MAG: hypothetical protein HRT61_24360 [Ekhidna sp.]|nr:hypothetical protein [Ekhidna sp.]
MNEDQLFLSQVDKRNLLDTAKWGKFLSILGFIFSTLIALGGLSLAGGSASEMFPGMGVGIGVVYVLISLIYIFPSLYLMRFSIQIKDGIEASDANLCSSAYNNLRRLFLFLGIMTIIVMGIYLLAVLFMIMGGNSRRNALIYS